MQRTPLALLAEHNAVILGDILLAIIALFFVALLAPAPAALASPARWHVRTLAARALPARWRVRARLAARTLLNLASQVHLAGCGVVHSARWGGLAKEGNP
jgi:hypothetical protein